MAVDVTRRALGDRWRPMGWWAGGMALYLIAVSAAWPSLNDSEDLQAAAQDYPQVFKSMFGGEEAFDMSQGSSFLQAQFFSLVVPLVLGVFAIAFAARTLAGEEEDGLLDLLLTHPVSRRQAVLEKGLGVAIAVGLLGLAVCLALVVVDLAVDFGVGLSYLLSAVVGTVLLALVHGVAAVLAGSLTGQHGAAVAGGAVVFVAGYLLMVVADLATDVSWLKYLSPFYYGTGTGALTDSWPVGPHLLLLALAVLGLAGSVVALERRDLGT